MVTVKMIGGPYHGEVYAVQGHCLVVPVSNGSGSKYEPGYRTVTIPFTRTADGFVALWPEKYDANKVQMPPVWYYQEYDN